MKWRKIVMKKRRKCDINQWHQNNHHRNKWHQYLTASNILRRKYNTMAKESNEELFCENGNEESVTSKPVW